jgi:hypothetical protein
MRVYLTNSDLATAEGKRLLELCLQVAIDAKLDLEEIKALRRWLRTNASVSMPAATYLRDIMERITADGIVDREEHLELELAVERVIPAAHRTPITQARKKRDADRRERSRERRQIEKEREKEERKRLREEEYTRAMRLRHTFAKVAGVTFPNDDGSERQEIISRCRSSEQLILQHDAYNEYSVFATKVLRTNGEQLGHAPEYLAEKIVDRIEDGYRPIGLLLNVTGGTFDCPTRGVNFVVFFIAPDVSQAELDSYASTVLASQRE